MLLRGKDNQYVIRINYRKRICCLWVSKRIAIDLWHGSPINEIKSSYPRGLYMRCKFCLGDDLSTSMAETRLPHKWACARKKVTWNYIIWIHSRFSRVIVYISKYYRLGAFECSYFYLENMTSPSKLVTQNHHIQCYILIIFCCYMHAERKLLLKKKNLKEQNWYIYKTRIFNS